MKEFCDLEEFFLTITFSLDVTGLIASSKLPVTVTWVSCPRSVPSTMLVASALFPGTTRVKLLTLLPSEATRLV